MIEYITCTMQLSMLYFCLCFFGSGGEKGAFWGRVSEESSAFPGLSCQIFFSSSVQNNYSESNKEQEKCDATDEY